MSDLYAVAGKKLFIGPAIALKKTDYAYSDFSALSFVEVDGWETHGAIGDTSTLISTDLINRARTVKQKGTRNAGTMENNFAIMPDDAGQAALELAERSKSNFAFKILGNDAEDARSATVTISNASPAVVSWALHGLTENVAVVFTTTGTLPTGLTAGTTYYVKTILDNGTFTVSATKGGTVINTTGAGSGTHTATTEPSPSERYFVALVMSNSEQGGTANTIEMVSVTLEVNSNVVKVPRLG